LVISSGFSLVLKIALVSKCSLKLEWLTFVTNLPPSSKELIKSVSSGPNGSIQK